MNRRKNHSIRAGAAFFLTMAAGIARAQEAAPPTPARPAATARPAGRLALDRAARESAAKMDATQKAMDARIRQVTRSICAGCSGSANRPYRRVPATADEPRPRDPAQAPED